MNIFQYLPWTGKPSGGESNRQIASLGEIPASEAISSAERDASLDDFKIKMSSIDLPTEGGDSMREKFARLEYRRKSTYTLPNNLVDGKSRGVSTFSLYSSSTGVTIRSLTPPNCDSGEASKESSVLSDKPDHSHDSLGKSVEVSQLSGTLADKSNWKYSRPLDTSAGDDTISDSKSKSPKVVPAESPVLQETQGSNMTHENQKPCQSCISTPLPPKSKSPKLTHRSKPPGIKLRDLICRADSAAQAEAERLKYTELQFGVEKTQYLDEVQKLRQLNHDQYLQIQNFQKSLSHYASHNEFLISQARAYETEIKKLREVYDLQAQKLARNEKEIGKLQRIELVKFRPSDVLLDEQARMSIYKDFFSKINTITRTYFRGITWQDINRSYNFVSPDTGVSSVLELPWIPAHWPVIDLNPKLSSQVLLEALISCTLGKRLFQDPFFQLDRNEVKRGLELLYSEATTRKIPTAGMWKAKTVDLLSQTKNEVFKAAASNDPPKLADSDSMIDQLYNSLSEMLVGLLRGRLGNSSFDVKSQTQEFRKDLSDLIRSSSQLAEDWHKRDFRLQVIDIHWLHKNDICWDSENAEKYITSSPKSRKLKEGVKYKILAVISPGFIRYEDGSEEGKGMEIVWQKAAVFLEEADIISITDAAVLSPMEI
ncbi:hypothetical protein H072_2449 [Dactylellina haptotyla CBS 200.50]|uniref:Uncharacterized protein n=1 Tax=Dactylellina haptotyla (strain CBS 200.50) TaxID=1284197 RepID=S8ARI9_DACHA|nr:hypothetical protein H072_2449 [Dactylellina haptotyla CBS 200.50]